MKASEKSPPAFSWQAWYDGLGGRTINIPEAEAILHKIYHEQFPQFESKTAAEKVHFENPEKAAEIIKAKAQEFGADIVGICKIEPSDIYKGRTVSEKYAIAVGARMRYRNFQTVPSEASAVECVRVYYDLGETVIELANYIRSLGWSCEIEHPIGDSNLLHIPIGLKAGFGELGRHGSIIHPKLGPLFRMGSVATSVPMKTDQPIDAGIAAFCDICRACRKYCPAKAIPDERSPEAGKDHLGNDRYVVDTGKCFPYFIKYNYCSACLPVCVYNHKEWARDFEGFKTKKFPDVVFDDAPEAFDRVPKEEKHFYPKVKR